MNLWINKSSNHIMVWMECIDCVVTESEELFQLRLEGLELLASARCEGREAASEPRLMGVPWREEPLSRHGGHGF